MIFRSSKPKALQSSRRLGSYTAGKASPMQTARRVPSMETYSGPSVDTSDRDLPAADVVEPRREVAERRLPRAGLADERGRRPGRDRERHVLHGPVVAVAEPDVLEDDVAASATASASGFSSTSIGWSRYSKIQAAAGKARRAARCGACSRGGRQGRRDAQAARRTSGRTCPSPLRVCAGGPPGTARAPPRPSTRRGRDGGGLMPYS